MGIAEKNGKEGVAPRTGGVTPLIAAPHTGRALSRLVAAPRRHPEGRALTEASPGCVVSPGTGPGSPRRDTH